MVDLTAEFTKAKKLLLATQQAVEKLETTESSAHVPSELEAISQDVGQKLRSLQLVNTALQTAWKEQANQLNVSKQTVWKQNKPTKQMLFFCLFTGKWSRMSRNTST